MRTARLFSPIAFALALAWAGAPIGLAAGDGAPSDAAGGEKSAPVEDRAEGENASGKDPAAAPAAEDEAFDEFDEYDEYALPEISDPFERFNRTIFKFNDTVYRRVLRPVSRGYEKIVPAVARRGLDSFFDNIRYPVRLVGSLLQGKLDRSAVETEKFLVNSTVGLAGFIRVSDRFPELRVPPEDVGQAFGKWGIEPGPFLIVPILGPTSTRDLVGRIGDTLLTPTYWDFLNHYDWEWRIGLRSTDVLNGMPGLMHDYDSLRQAALDPYIAFRNGFLQHRRAAVAK